MALDPNAITQGVITGIATQKAMQATDKVINPQDGPSHQDRVIELLTKIHTALSPTPKDAIDEPMLLQPYPYEYIIPGDLRGRPHVCIFFYVATPVRFDGTMGGTYNKTVGPGWIQLDLEGRLSTTDAQSHYAVISYREDALGAAF